MPPEQPGDAEFLDEVKRPSVAHASVPPKRAVAEAPSEELFVAEESEFELAASTQQSDVSETEWLEVAGPKPAVEETGDKGELTADVDPPVLASDEAESSADEDEIVTAETAAELSEQSEEEQSIASGEPVEIEACDEVVEVTVEAEADTADETGGVAIRVDAAQPSPRRQLLDRYRSQLGDLQAQLADLSSLRTPEDSEDVADGSSDD